MVDCTLDMGKELCCATLCFEYGKNKTNMRLRLDIEEGRDAALLNLLGPLKDTSLKISFDFENNLFQNYTSTRRL